MKTRRHLWWLLRGVLFLCCVGFVGAACHFEWSSMGSLNETVWDWLQLLSVSLVLAIVALLFQLANTHTALQIEQQRYKQDQHVALDKQHEITFQTYLDHISELMLRENLRVSSCEEIRNIARARTITVLTQLDTQRVRRVLVFLREAGLVSETLDGSVVSLKDADLRAIQWGQADLHKVFLEGADLREADLHGADLREADLHGADLREANLHGANLHGANLRGTRLSEADLSEADLSEADLSEANLSGANLSGAILKGAGLIEADLSGAVLITANFSKTSFRTSLEGANLSRTNLAGADLSGAILIDANFNKATLGGDGRRGVNLSEANLSGATITEEQLQKAGSLQGATMPDGATHV